MEWMEGGTTEAAIYTVVVLVARCAKRHPRLFRTVPCWHATTNVLYYSSVINMFFL